MPTSGRKYITGTNIQKLNTNYQMRNDRKVHAYVALLITFMASILPATAYSYDFEVDKIAYSKINETEVEVARGLNFSADPNWNVILPPNVTFNGESYSVTAIGDYAFNYNDALNSIEIPNSVTSIGEGAFSNCRSLKSVKIPNSVKAIGNKAFIECYSLTSIEIPESVTTIGESSFLYCSSLKEIKVDKDNTYYASINGVLFNQDLTYLIRAPAELTGSYTIPNSVTSIADHAFDRCRLLSSIKIPNSVNSIGNLAFFMCESLTSIELPNTVTSIGEEVFGCCYYLTSVKIPNSINKISDALFHDCYKLSSIEIPNSITSIGSEAFSVCLSLTSIEIPNSVTEIGDQAFRYMSNLTSIEIPSSVISIGDRAFSECGFLTELKCLSTTPPILGDEAFLNTRDSKILYVPKAALDAYKASDWAECFKEISTLPSIEMTIEMEGEGKVYYNNSEVDNGAVLEEGVITLFVFADDGNEIESAILDNEDIKDQINNHILTIDVCKENGILKVVFAPEKEASLAVKGAESHSLTHYYKDGFQARIDLQPEEGWHLYSLIFNGEDVTEDVANNIYTTPALSGANSLEVVMQSDVDTDVETIGIAYRRISFRKNGNFVEILNLEDGEQISIYNAEGRCEHQGREHTVALDPNNVYILRTQKETLKFTL